ncbi:MAG: hypothetical protein M1445_10215 [Bacteroidetes bacterium]|nr:hypothetical protein [Bacteroidota bacterium]MCL6103337.1 hypothetical protein [Bacteroidota bacterium]
MRQIDAITVIPPIEETKIYKVRVLCDYDDSEESEILKFYRENRRYIEIFAGDNIRNLPVDFPFKIGENNFIFLLSL